MKLALEALSVPGRVERQILERWLIAGQPPITEYAPYVAYVLKVVIFFEMALAAGHISCKRASNSVDISYLFYLPFCMMFVSSDRLHRRCAPLFLRSDQEFVWGEELKRGLHELDVYYSRMPTSEKEKGVITFASVPPKEGDFIVARLWDRQCPGWRKGENTGRSKDDRELLEIIEKTMHAPPLRLGEGALDLPDPESVSMKRFVRRKKGSWYQVPKGLK
jgi:hypothetical protein